MQSSVDQDHYKALGLPKNASTDDVRKAYKKLAKEWHPDKNLDIKDSAELKFKEISEAHRVLSDSHKRHEYDRMRENIKRDRELQEERRRRDNIRRMAKEQKDYVAKQEEKRRKAQRMRAAYNGKVQDYEDSEKAFSNFFEDREHWRKSVPDLYSAEASNLNQMMNTMFKMSSDMTYVKFGDSVECDLRKIQKDLDLLKIRQNRLEDQLSRFKSERKKYYQLFSNYQNVFPRTVDLQTAPP